MTWTLDMPHIRPWSEMWRLVQHNYAIVESRYYHSISTPNNDVIKYDVYNFFVSAYHLHEHLAKDRIDSLVDDSVRSAALDAATAPPIKLAGDITNTFKHHTRSRGREVRIVQLTSAPSATLGWINRDGSSETRDVLVAAQEVVSFWRQFIFDHGLTA